MVTEADLLKDFEAKDKYIDALDVVELNRYAVVALRSHHLIFIRSIHLAANNVEIFDP